MEAQAAKERERLQAEEKAHARRMAAAGEAGKDDQARNFHDVYRYFLAFSTSVFVRRSGHSSKGTGQKYDFHLYRTSIFNTFHGNSNTY